MCAFKRGRDFLLSVYLSRKSAERWAQLEPLFRKNLKSESGKKRQKSKNLRKYKQSYNSFNFHQEAFQKAQSVNIMRFYFFLASSYQHAFPSLSPIVPLLPLSHSLTPNGINPGWHFGPRFYKLLHIIGNDPNSIAYTSPCNLVSYHLMCPGTRSTTFPS